MEGIEQLISNQQALITKLQNEPDNVDVEKLLTAICGLEKLVDMNEEDDFLSTLDSDGVFEIGVYEPQQLQSIQPLLIEEVIESAEDYDEVQSDTLDNSLKWYKKMNDALQEKIIKDIDFIKKASKKELEEYKNKVLNK